MKKKLKKEKSFNNVDVDSDSDDEEIDRIMVKSVVGTIRNVEKTKKKWKKLQASRRKYCWIKIDKNQRSVSLDHSKLTLVQLLHPTNESHVEE